MKIGHLVVIALMMVSATPRSQLGDVNNGVVDVK